MNTPVRASVKRTPVVRRHERTGRPSGSSRALANGRVGASPTVSREVDRWRCQFGVAELALNQVERDALAQTGAGGTRAARPRVTRWRFSRTGPSAGAPHVVGEERVSASVPACRHRVRTRLATGPGFRASGSQSGRGSRGACGRVLTSSRSKPSRSAASMRAANVCVGRLVHRVRGAGRGHRSSRALAVARSGGIRRRWGRARGFGHCGSRLFGLSRRSAGTGRSLAVSKLGREIASGGFQPSMGIRFLGRVQRDPRREAV